MKGSIVFLNITLMLSSLMFSCSVDHEKNDLKGIHKQAENKLNSEEQKNIQTHKDRSEDQEVKEVDYRTLEEKFHSTKIAEHDSFRLEVQQVRTNNGVFVEIELFKREGQLWMLKQMFRKEKDGITPLRAVLEDFNADGYKDLTFAYSTAARGANEIKKLYIFDPIMIRLREIKNSDHYPNLLYNRVLNCIDCQMIYGGTTTEFLKLKGDSLVPFAGVTLFHGLLDIYTIDNKGNRKYLVKEKPNKKFEDFDRFINYDPLKVRI